MFLELVGFETSKETVSLQFTCLGPDEMKILSENGAESQIKYKCLFTKRGENKGREFALDPGATYEFRVKAVIPGAKEGEWERKREYRSWMDRHQKNWRRSSRTSKEF